MNSATWVQFQATECQGSRDFDLGQVNLYLSNTLLRRYLFVVLWWYFFQTGEEVAFYFAWMSFFTWSLVPIALFGVVLFLHRPKGITVDDSPYLPVYALLMALWTIVYIKVIIICLIILCFKYRCEYPYLSWIWQYTTTFTVIQLAAYHSMFCMN